MNKRLTNEQISEMANLYKEFGNVWKVGEILGKCGQSVHEALSRRGLINKMNKFSDDDYKFLNENYLIYRDSGRLLELSIILSRTKQFVCRKANELGLTAIKYRMSEKHITANRQAAVGKWGRHTHPKGMLGKKHSPETVSGMSKRVKELWADPLSKFNSVEHREALSERMSKRMLDDNAKSNNYSRTKKGYFKKDNLLIPMRSSWELNYAHYLNKLEKESKIVKWEYEPDVFKFPELRIGVKVYTPDFKVFYQGGKVIYHEVKGWMDIKSKIKLKLMKTHYPLTKIKLIDKVKYKAIEKKKLTIDGWGTFIAKKNDN